MDKNQCSSYITGARIWIPHPESVWEGATVTTNYVANDKKIKYTTVGGIEGEFIVTNENQLPFLRNPGILIGQNDLTALSYLHEPDVLHTLEVRFCDRQTIYTYCGIVLVAINPYAELPLYGADIIRTYRGQSNQSLEPHIFAVAEDAYAKLEREKCDLSIIVSGESGAGKTVSAKYAMRYFAAVGGNESETQIERKILASSPIMEAIGNAKTTRNDNSSRFGKFTKLLFKNQLNVMSLTGATMQTYLLEKSRVVFQATDERNYHIFYQLCAARDQWPDLMLDDHNKFRYLNQGGVPFINRVSDLDQCIETVAALHTLGFTDNDVGDIVRTCAAILHLGNVTIAPKYKRQSKEIDQEECEIDLNDFHLNHFADLLKLDSDQLRTWLTTRKIESMNELVLIPMNQTSAEAARDALAKHIYAKLFQHIVNIVNRSLETDQEQHCFIGVLDIYGFETFQTNSFEQFCINYANEKLQQQFNQHIFKLEQEQYLEEGIDWKMIDFYDNQPCIELIESKLGVLDLLDEECRMPRGSDESWVGKLNQKCVKFKHFEKTRFGTTAFTVKHFSDDVEYTCSGFLEKNRDTISKELVNVLRESELNICNRLMSLNDVADANELDRSLGGRVVISAAKQLITPSKQHRQTVGTQFRDSLSKLIKTLHSTTPHYVRCIKPNDEKIAFKWDAQKIVQQLRACGVLETIRISAAGFPSRWTYENFYSRYFLLCRLSQTNDDEKLACTHIVQNYIADEDKYRFGHTQIFFRAGQVAHLEQVRMDVRKKYIIVVQSMVRRFCARRLFLLKKKLALNLQRYARGYLARKRTEMIRKNRAVIVIQRFLRGWICRYRYQRIRQSTMLIQTYGRGFLARRHFTNKLNNFKATEIQRFCRGYLARKAFTNQKRKIVLCQSTIRRFLARRQFKKLKAEARTITHMQKMYKGLENKIISLQQKMDEVNKANGQLRQKNAEIPELMKKLESKKSLEAELKSLHATVIEKETSLKSTVAHLNREQDEKMLILEEKLKEEEAFKEQQKAVANENDELRTKMNELQDKVKQLESVSSQRLLLDDKNNDIHQAYQELIKENQFLSTENYVLKEEINRLLKYVPISSVTHSRSISNVSSINLEEDFGYSSARNTLELKRDKINELLATPSSAVAVEKEIHSRNNNITDPNHTPETFEKFDASTPKRSEVLTILKIQKLLEEEITKRRIVEKQLKRTQSKLTNANCGTEDSIRASELEVENEKLRKEFLLLRNSINRGVAQQELEAEFLALEEENKRRRDECIQLRCILAQRNNTVHTNNVPTSANRSTDSSYDNELVQAFEAQKLVNRQLEAELTALTEESNAKMIDLNANIDELRNDRNKLEEILHNQIELQTNGKMKDENPIENQQTVDYLLHEIRTNTAAYAEILEEGNRASRMVKDLSKKNAILSKRLRDNGLDDSILVNENINDLAIVIKRTQVFRGIFKYRPEDIGKIIKRIVDDLTPRVAITLFPGLPAYILFMCIRYTDLINSDESVRSILTLFLTSVKKIFQTPQPSENHVLWLVNTIKLNNLLKQYGGIDEYMKLNTNMQNQQQLKNFDLSEYRQIIHKTIIDHYEQLVHQVQEVLKNHIVPAILHHDEMARSRKSVGDSQQHKNEQKLLINHLDHFFKQLKFFGLDDIFIEQIFKQLFYFICAISLNNLMLRQEVCMWKTGMKIRYNITLLENWARQMKMGTETVMPLTPLIQVCSLLQLRKTEEDVPNICEQCTCLTTAQVLKIIKSYSLDDSENPIKPAFIEKLTIELNKRRNELQSSNDKFTMEEGFVHPLKVVDKYDETKLEEIELPPILNLATLLTPI